MAEPGFLPRPRFQHLLAALTAAGYRCLGPKVRDGAIVYEELDGADDVPRGVHDHQQPGAYRLQQDDSPRCFAWANGPQALKPLLFAPREILWTSAAGSDGGITFHPQMPEALPTAVIGVRACDLAALRLQDQHFLEGPSPDPHYGVRRRNLFLVAVHCTHPAATCFCASTGDGPRAESGFDLALAELDEGFIVTAGSPKGEVLFGQLPLEALDPAQQVTADGEIAAAAQAQQRTLPSRNLRDGLFANLHHPRWDDVAQRCLSCTNCSSVCPTCFCHAETEEPALDGSHSAHYRQWDSCFTEGHSYIHGIVIRADTRLRYRQWLTHKLGSWHDQYGRSGCVGCGRCIAWCPVGIDITAEAAAVCGGDHA
ncbi:MAG: 4Fe-4S dicluster domain-containing protein [Acidithiobacillus sp.]